MLQRLLFLFFPFLFACAGLAAQHPEILISGPMAASVYPHRATIWLQTREEAELQCSCQRLADSITVFSDKKRSTAENDFVVHLQLKDLRADHYYACDLWVNGKIQDKTYSSHFRTPPAKGQIVDFSMAVGSCAYLNDKRYESGKKLFKYGNRTEIFDSIARHKADYMFWLGDNIYLREGEWNSQEGVWYRYRHTRFHPALQQVLRTGSHFAIWDDHDFGPNDSDSSYKLKEMTARSFKQYWPNPEPVDSQSIYTNYRIGDAEFFLMDDRFYRAPNDAEASPQKAFLGEKQLNWLIESLRKSDANFKIVAIGTQVFSNCNLAEGYIFGYEHEFDRMLRRIKEAHIEGVLFFSGDKHLTEISRFDYPGLYPLYDVTISPFTSFPVPFKLSNSHRVKGTFVGRRNYGILHFEGRGEERKMVIDIYSVKGKLLWQRTIWARNLRGESREPRSKNRD